MFHRWYQFFSTWLRRSSLQCEKRKERVLHAKWDDLTPAQQKSLQNAARWNDELSEET